VYAGVSSVGANLWISVRESGGGGNGWTSVRDAGGGVGNRGGGWLRCGGTDGTRGGGRCDDARASGAAGRGKPGGVTAGTPSRTVAAVGGLGVGARGAGGTTARMVTDGRGAGTPSRGVTGGSADEARSRSVEGATDGTPSRVVGAAAMPSGSVFAARLPREDGGPDGGCGMTAVVSRLSRRTSGGAGRDTLPGRGVVATVLIVREVEDVIAGFSQPTWRFCSPGKSVSTSCASRAATSAGELRAKTNASSSRARIAAEG